jgi:peptide/nickel transport system permease protein
MLLFLLKRIAAIAPVLLGVSFVVFLMVELAPGDVTTLLLGPLASEEARAALRKALGLDRPILVQYVWWLQHVLSGDLGVSIATSRRVVDLLAPRLVATVLLGGASLALTIVVGVAVGVAAAARAGRWFDRVARSLMLVVGNLPPYWLGLVLVLIFSLQLRLFPTSGMRSVAADGGVGDVLDHLVLPAITTAAAPAAVVAAMVRAALIEALGLDYIKVARAKGVPRRTLILKHAMRNALPTIVTIIGLQMGYLFGGALFSEVVFAWPGLGQLLYTSIVGRDLPVIQASVLAIALVFVVVNLGVDLINQAVDPRGLHG